MPRTAALKPEQAPTDSKPTLDHPIFMNARLFWGDDLFLCAGIHGGSIFRRSKCASRTLRC